MDIHAGHLYEVKIADDNARPYEGDVYVNHVSTDVRPDGTRSISLIIVRDNMGPDVVECVTVNSKCLVRDLGKGRVRLCGGEYGI